MTGRDGGGTGVSEREIEKERERSRDMEKKRGREGEKGSERDRVHLCKLNFRFGAIVVSC